MKEVFGSIGLASVAAGTLTTEEIAFANDLEGRYLLKVLEIEYHFPSPGLLIALPTATDEDYDFTVMTLAGPAPDYSATAPIGVATRKVVPGSLYSVGLQMIGTAVGPVAFAPYQLTFPACTVPDDTLTVGVENRTRAFGASAVPMQYRIGYDFQKVSQDVYFSLFQRFFG